MKAKLTINEKEFEVEITEEQAQALTETKKKTGYERVAQGEFYYVETNDGTTDFFKEEYKDFDDKYYEGADYYSDRTVAENNARADKLYRQLRRFVVEHREKDIDWNNVNMNKYIIYYNHIDNSLYINSYVSYQLFNVIFFDTKKSAQLAIDTFKDELLWYFTKYKDSL